MLIACQQCTMLVLCVTCDKWVCKVTRVWPRPPLPAARSQPRTELSRGSGTSHSFCHSGFPWNLDVRHMSMSDTTWSPIVDCLWSRYIWCLVFFNNWIKNQWGLFLSDGHTRVKLIEHFCPIPVTPLLSRWSSYRQAHMTTPSIDWVFKSLWPPFHSPSFTTRPTNAQQMKKADINTFILGWQTHFQLTAHFLSLPHTLKIGNLWNLWMMKYAPPPPPCIVYVCGIKSEERPDQSFTIDDWYFPSFMSTLYILWLMTGNLKSAAFERRNLQRWYSIPDHAPHHHHQPTLHAIRTLVILTFLTPSSRNFAPNMPSLSSSAILILLFVIYFRSFIVKQKFFGATRVLQHIITEGVHCCEKLVLLSLLSGVPNQSIILTSRAAAGRKKVLTEHVTDSTVFIISDILCTVFIALSEPPPRTDSQHGHGRQQWW